MAVLGILFANIRSWSGYRFIPLTEIESLPAYHLDGLFNSLHYWLVDGKFYAIFSMLFGAGFGIQYLKNQQNQPPFIKKYRRRLGLLLLFGRKGVSGRKGVRALFLCTPPDQQKLLMNTQWRTL
jgi:uncharacterized protein